MVRSQLYKLSKIPGKSKIIDLGNMKQGVTFNDTLAGLTDILVQMLAGKSFPGNYRRKQCTCSGN